MFRTVPVSIIRSLFTIHSAILYVIQVCRQLAFEQDYPGPARKLSTSLTLLSVQWINSWWWTGEMYETSQNKFVKLVHLVSFIIKKFVTYFGMKLYMFRTVRLSIIRSLFTVHSAMVYVIQVCRQLSSRTRMVLLESCLQTLHCWVYSE